MAGGYPTEHGKRKGGVLSEFMTPLNIEAEKGDKYVPANDMGGVSRLASGGMVPDPLDYISVIEKSKK